MGRGHMAVFVVAAMAASGVGCGGDDQADGAEDVRADDSARMDGEAGADGDADADADAEAEADGDTDAVAEAEADGDADAEAEADGDAEAEADAADPYCEPRAGVLSFTALEASGEGAAAWNAAAGAPEPEAHGHSIPWAPSCLGYAYYYLASRDWVDETATAALHVTRVESGFATFDAAVLAAGRSPADVRVRFGVMGLGDDVEGSDWTYDSGTAVETRHYRGGTLTILLGDEPLVAGPMPELTVFARYHNVPDCFDDEIDGETAFVLLEDASAAASPGAQAAAAAFLDDVGGFGVQIRFGSLQPIGVTEFTEHNRTGAYMEAHEGWIEIGATAISSRCE